MITAYRASTGSLARSVLSITLRFSRPKSTHNPLKPTVETDELGLPVTPAPLPIPDIPRANLSRETLVKLHRLSALKPPEEGSPEEMQLKAELGELLGLMDIVKNVEMPQGEVNLRQLLTEGVSEVVIDEKVAEVGAGLQQARMEEKLEHREKHGKELLDWATRRVGDYYASRVK
jgi:hypothetical protein